MLVLNKIQTLWKTNVGKQSFFHFLFFFHHFGTALDEGLAHMHFVHYFNSTSFTEEREMQLCKRADNKAHAEWVTWKETPMEAINVARSSQEPQSLMMYLSFKKKKKEIK